MFNILTIMIFNNLLTAVNASVSPLRNQTFLMSAGGHGLKITLFGNAFVFSCYWTQLIEVRYNPFLSAGLETFGDHFVWSV